MPDDKGKLSEEEKTKALEWLNSHQKSPCPFCRAGSFGLAEVMASMPVMGNKGKETNTSIPAVVLICQNCHYMMPFSAVKVGIAPPKEQGNA